MEVTSREGSGLSRVGWWLTPLASFCLSVPEVSQGQVPLFMVLGMEGRTKLPLQIRPQLGVCTRGTQKHRPHPCCSRPQWCLSGAPMRCPPLSPVAECTGEAVLVPAPYTVRLAPEAGWCSSAGPTCGPCPDHLLPALDSWQRRLTQRHTRARTRRAGGGSERRWGRQAGEGTDL